MDLSESMLGKRRLFHYNNDGYHFWWLYPVLKCSARDLVCISCSQQGGPVGIMLTILHKRKLQPHKVGRGAQCHTTDKLQSWGFCWIFLQDHLCACCLPLTQHCVLILQCVYTYLVVNSLHSSPCTKLLGHMT